MTREILIHIMAIMGDNKLSSGDAHMMYVYLIGLYLMCVLAVCQAPLSSVVLYYSVALREKG